MTKVEKMSNSKFTNYNHLELYQTKNLKGHEIIKYISKTLPKKPGVYQMENEKWEILYIGKA